MVSSSVLPSASSVHAERTSSSRPTPRVQAATPSRSGSQEDTTRAVRSSPALARPAARGGVDGSPACAVPRSVQAALNEKPRNAKAVKFQEFTRHLHGSFADFVVHFSELAEKDFDALRSEVLGRLAAFERVLEREARERTLIEVELRSRCAELEAERQREEVMERFALGEDLSAMKRRLDYVESAIGPRADERTGGLQEAAAETGISAAMRRLDVLEGALGTRAEGAVTEKAGLGEDLSAVKQRLDHLESTLGAWAETHAGAIQRLEAAQEGFAAELAAFGEARAQHLEVEEFLDTAVRGLGEQVAAAQASLDELSRGLAAAPRSCEAASPPSGARGERAAGAAASSGVGQAMEFKDGVRGGKGTECIISFPGSFPDDWNEMVGAVELTKKLVAEDSELALFSTACVFLPEGTPCYGRHRRNDEDGDECYCLKLYKERKDWGCEWFHLWKQLLDEAVRRGQELTVVYREGEVGRGDDIAWGRLPDFTAGAPGLGGSQRGEVAWARHRYPGLALRKRDVREVASGIADRVRQAFGRLCRGDGEVQARIRVVLHALRQSPAAQKGLRQLILNDAGIDEAGTMALSAELPRCTALRVVDLTDNKIGEVGAKALAAALPRCSTLRELYLRNNGIGDAGIAALAGALPQCLEQLGLEGNKIREAGAAALAAQLPRYPALARLYLSDNEAGEAGAAELAGALPHCAALRTLTLFGNGVGQAGGRWLRAVAPDLDLHIEAGAH